MKNFLGKFQIIDNFSTSTFAINLHRVKFRAKQSLQRRSLSFLFEANSFMMKSTGRWKAKLSGIFLERKSTKTYCQKKKKERKKIKFQQSQQSTVFGSEVEVFQANSSFNIESPPLFGEIDIRRWEAKLGKGREEI